MSQGKLAHQREGWQEIWKHRGIRTTIVDIGRSIYNWFFRRYLRRFITPETRLLEIGCGTATLTLSLAPEIKELVGLDNADSALELSRAHAEKMGVKNSTFVLGDCLSLQYTEAFDVVWSQGLLEHFEDSDTVVREHYKAVKPGGIALISVPYKYSYHTVWYILTRPKFLQFLWPWTSMILLDKKTLLRVGKKYTPEARVHFLQLFPLGIAILELPKK